MVLVTEMGLAEKKVGVYSSIVKTKTSKPSTTRTKKPAEAAAPAGRQSGPKDKDLETIHTEVTATPEKQHLEDWVQVQCPYCGEDIELHVTSEQDGQSMYEDCGVCCRPVQVHIHVEDDELQVEAHRS